MRDLASGRTVVVATALGSLDGVEALVDGADAILLDGTFWRDDELVALGLGRARAQDMAHVPVGGAEGSLARLASLASWRGRAASTRTSTTPTPCSATDSPERAHVEQAGWEIAFDGMEIAL